MKSLKKVLAKTQNIATRGVQLLVLGTMAALTVVAPVSAAIPAWATAIITDLTADAGTFMTSLSAVFVIFVVGFLWMKILKNGVSKVT